MELIVGGCKQEDQAGSKEQGRNKSTMCSHGLGFDERLKLDVGCSFHECLWARGAYRDVGFEMSLGISELICRLVSLVQYWEGGLIKLFIAAVAYYNYGQRQRA
ncbi:unnamed protein product [Onchocerca flexuosa]|uniref:Uncharacterized protein n=1 Tax=Onchocerca flexuosa TaxID=387005 RepID=A0A183H1A2_9BILA|nr:unnamed protein product [Onchocerca flexuosa]